MFSASITFQRYQFKLNAALQLKKGTITALLGASGSGKSSLFRVLSGLEKPLTGQIYSHNRCWFDAEKKTNLDIQHRKVGMVFQDYALFEHLTVYDNIAYGIEKTTPEEQSQIVKTWLQRISLSHKAQAYPQALSGGEKQRVALARALAAQPEILFLDEPFSALDAAIRHELRRELQTLIKDAQIPVLIATHDLLEARFLADAVCVLADGNIIQQGPTASVFKQPKTTQAAKVLGWQNILPVTSFDADIVRGVWGALQYQHESPLSLAALAIPLEALSIGSSSSATQNTLIATITHHADMGDHFLIEAVLNGGGSLTFRQPIDHSIKPDVKPLINPSPTLGEAVNVAVDLPRVIPLSI